MRIDSPSLINDHSASKVTRPCGLITINRQNMSFVSSERDYIETCKCILSNKSAVGFDLGIVLMHCKILESFKGTKGDWMKSLKAFCTEFQRDFFEREWKPEFSFFFTGQVKSIHPIQIAIWDNNLGPLFCFKFWVSFSQTARLQGCNCNCNWLIARMPEF